MKLWHDDWREPPTEEWKWAQTNEEARTLLSTRQVEIISLDYDLLTGPLVPSLDGDYHAPNGADLVRWMLSSGPIPLPHTIIIHSDNPDGAREMAELFQSCGIAGVYLRPYSGLTVSR